MDITKESIESFFKQNSVIRLGELYAQQINLEKEFDVLSVFDDLLIENAWSRVFAYLLNSENSHGLGGGFLKAFLNEGKESSELVNQYLKALKLNDSDQIFVELEWQTEQKRRLDILIKISNKKGILKGIVGIENKLFAGEQYAQVSDYQAELKNKFKAIPKLLLFLSIDGRESITMDEENIECPCISLGYRSILRSIENTKSGNKNAQTFLNILNQHMTKLTNSKTAEDKIKKLVRGIYSNKNNREIIEAIMQYIPGTRDVTELLEHNLREYDGIPKKAKSEDYFFYFFPETGNPYEYKVDLPGLYHKKLKLYVTYVLLADRDPKIGSTFQLRIAVWRENSKYDSTQIRRAFEIDGTKGGLKDWANKCWVNIWTGDRYTLQDLGKKDAEGLFNIFKSAYLETYKQLRTICNSNK